MSSTGMTGEGGYFHDTILFPGSQCLGTGITPKGLLGDIIIKEPVSATFMTSS
ncbi:hypothetical protein [Wolbachia endosymbiont (group A) of Brachyopa scutellaris]|uniref:hypothetical protein n=1 Tax=Wolbachia endosymbiont (group A) of Brachyopa scutellaris TaxID=3066140 RepID=UPI003132B061